MDPQQRKLLEVVFETFESAGVTLDQVSGANVGCYGALLTFLHISLSFIAIVRSNSWDGMQWPPSRRNI
jgi:hypothetical protein